MIPIKIYCGCGQHYCFDVEAVDGRMPTEVACPTCGVDGTEAANAIIAQTMVPEAALGMQRLRIGGDGEFNQASNSSATPASVSTLRGMTSFMPKVERPQGEHEARAKILWGDPPDEVTRFLMLHGFNVDEASETVGKMYQERLSTLRSNGVKKIIIGIGLMCVPVIALVIFLSIGVIPLKLFAVTILVGLWGGWMVLKGFFMVLAPKSERGDVSEQ